MCLNHLESLIFFKNGFRSWGLLQVSGAEFSPDHMSSLTWVTLCGPLSIMWDLPPEKILHPHVSAVTEKQIQRSDTVVWYEGFGFLEACFILLWGNKANFWKKAREFEQYSPERLRPINIIKVCIKFIPQAVVTNDTKHSKRCWTWLREGNETWMKVNNHLAYCKPVPCWACAPDGKLAEWKEVPSSDRPLSCMDFTGSTTFTQAELGHNGWWLEVLLVALTYLNCISGAYKCS